MDPVVFGTCPCAGSYEDKRVDITLTVDDEQVVLANVPQGECDVCGSTAYKLDDMARLEAALRGRRTDPVLAARG